MRSMVIIGLVLFVIAALLYLFKPIVPLQSSLSQPQAVSITRTMELPTGWPQWLLLPKGATISGSGLDGNGVSHVEYNVANIGALEEFDSVSELLMQNGFDRGAF